MLLVIGIAYCLVASLRRIEDWKRYALLLVWLVLPIALLAWQSSTVYLHYLVLLEPVLFLLLALPLELLLRQPRWRWLGPGLVAAVALPQLASWVLLQQTLRIYETDEASEAPQAERRLLAELGRESGQRIGTGESYGVQVPLRYWLAVADRTRSAMSESRRELLLATVGTNPRAAELPAILETVLGPDLRPRYQSAGTLAVPIGRPALLVVTSDVEPPVPPEKIGRERTLIPLPTLARNTRDGTRLYDLRARSAPEWLRALGATSVVQPPANSPLFGVKGPRQAKAGETIEVLTLWRGDNSPLQPRVSLADRSSGLAEEKNEQDRTAVVVSPAQLLIVKHELTVPARTVPGSYRLEAIEAPSRARRELSGLVVTAR
jgi:hypothetical protein